MPETKPTETAQLSPKDIKSLLVTRKKKAENHRSSGLIYLIFIMKSFIGPKKVGTKKVFSPLTYPVSFRFTTIIKQLLVTQIFQLLGICHIHHTYIMDLKEFFKGKHAGTLYYFSKIVMLLTKEEVIIVRLGKKKNKNKRKQRTSNKRGPPQES